jgi:hypothetical protein
MHEQRRKQRRLFGAAAGESAMTGRNVEQRKEQR